MATDIQSVFAQLIIVTMIPFIVYLISKRKVRGFFKYIGLYAAPRKALLQGLAASLIFLVVGVGVIFLSGEFRETLLSEETISGKFRAQDFSIPMLITLILFATIKTGLTEEILFRGFVAKRLISVAGYRWGNILQALIFGAIHVVIFLAIEGVGLSVFIFMGIFTFVISIVLVNINEKSGNGSILPSWIAHGTGNLLSYMIVAFLI